MVVFEWFPTFLFDPATMFAVLEVAVVVDTFAETLLELGSCRKNGVVKVSVILYCFYSGF